MVNKLENTGPDPEMHIQVLDADTKKKLVDKIIFQEKPGNLQTVQDCNCKTGTVGIGCQILLGG